jgi:hypothetical protein
LLALEIRKQWSPSHPLTSLANAHVLLSDNQVKQAPLHGVHVWTGCESDLTTSFLPASSVSFSRVNTAYVPLFKDDPQLLLKVMQTLGVSCGLYLPVELTAVPGFFISKESVCVGLEQQLLRMELSEHEETRDIIESCDSVGVKASICTAMELQDTLSELDRMPAGSKKNARCASFMKYVLSSWDDIIEKIPPCSVTLEYTSNRGIGVLKVDLPSFAVLLLCRARWLLVKSSPVNGGELALAAPENLMVARPDDSRMRRVLTPFLSELQLEKFPCANAFKALKFAGNLSVSVLLQALAQLKQSVDQSGAGIEEENPHFERHLLKREHLLSMYTYLAEEAAQDAFLAQKLKSQPIMIVPLEREGVFVFATPSKCTWLDYTSSGLMDRDNGGRLYVLLQRFGRESSALGKHFEVLGVCATPSYLQLLERLDSLASEDLATVDFNSSLQSKSKSQAFELLAAVGKATKTARRVDGGGATISVREMMHEVREFLQKRPCLPTLSKQPGLQSWSPLASSDHLAPVFQNLENISTHNTCT